MPVSHPNHIPAVLHLAYELSPARVLDVGIGLGSMGLLLRQVLDVSHGRLLRQDWRARLEGIEIYPAYRNPIWDFAYDAVHECDVRDFLANQPPRFDLVLCCDVLEHFPLAEARRLARELVRISGCLIATTPTSEYAQGPWFGNEAEAHHCTLGAADFPDLVASDSVGVTSWYACSSDPDVAARVRAIAARAPRVSPRQAMRDRLLAPLRRMKQRLRPRP